MTVWKLFNGPVAEVSTYHFHEDRERAPHLEQGIHVGRLTKAAEFVLLAATWARLRLGESDSPVTVSDLGCGDGGLLSLLKDVSVIDEAWGYDFAPANIEGWQERGIDAALVDAFNPLQQHRVRLGDIVVTTEVLEHLTDPHGTVRRLHERGARFLVASSPYTETDVSHDACHAWAFDYDGYESMIRNAGWTIRRHVTVDLFQVVLAER